MIRQLRAAALCAAVTLAGCASRPTRVPESQLAYPHGTYQHKVKVHVVQPARTMDVRGIVDSKPDELKVVGVSSFGTTVFRIDENLKTGELSKEFYYDALRRHEERVMFFYSLLKQLLNAPKGRSEFEKDGARFSLSEPDENRIFRRVAITHPQVNLDIEVTGYEF